MRTIIITGASSGLGREIFNRLPDNDLKINWSLPDVNVADSHSVGLAAGRLMMQSDPLAPVDILINCAGVNDIAYLGDLSEAQYDRVMSTNAKGIFNTTQALLPRLAGGTILNIVSNAATVPMTASLAYNASKGAALIMTKQLARELKKTHDITVFSISPNKLAGTGMSRYIEERVTKVRGWSAEAARNYQLAALPAGEETDPRTLAEFIAFLLSSKERHKYLAGCDIPYGA